MITFILRTSGDIPMTKIVVRCPDEKCSGRDTLTLTHEFGYSGSIRFFCNNHNSVLGKDDVEFEIE